MKNFDTLLFYKYVHLDDAPVLAQRHLKFCKQLGVKGRVLFGYEGLNGTVSGTTAQCKAYMDELRKDVRLQDLIFKVDEEDNHSFNRIHVRFKKEIVHFGSDDVNVFEMKGKYLEPADWIKAMHDENTVILDTRNDYEWEVGRFKNAVTLPIRTFREFPDAVKDLEALKGKKILAYCTGGIRCEKATAYLLKAGFEDVYHLHGGIIQYAKDTGGPDFEGKCYVFDKRLTVDINSVNPTVISHCRTCGAESTHFVNCANPECNEHFIQCETCGWKMEGACSAECQSHPRKRVFDGTGYYAKPDTFLKD